MIPRRLAALIVLPLLAAPRAPGRAMAVPGPAAPRNCGDPGGRFIACEALQEALPAATGAGRCPVCGGRHREAAQR
jgi:hypothetical protein